MWYNVMAYDSGIIMKQEINKQEQTNIKVTLKTKDIATVVGETCNECYGVIGLTNGDSLMSKLIILKKENYVDGVNVFKEKGKFSIDIHLVCAYGIKITEVVNEVSKRVSYVLKEKYGQLFHKINVYVDEIREI